MDHIVDPPTSGGAIREGGGGGTASLNVATDCQTTTPVF